MCLCLGSRRESESDLERKVGNRVQLMSAVKRRDDDACTNNQDTNQTKADSLEGVRQRWGKCKVGKERGRAKQGVRTIVTQQGPANQGLGDLSYGVTAAYRLTEVRGMAQWIVGCGQGGRESMVRPLKPIRSVGLI